MPGAVHAFIQFEERRGPDAHSGRSQASTMMKIYRRRQRRHLHQPTGGEIHSYDFTLGNASMRSRTRIGTQPGLKHCARR
jgi:hypothetical protein